MKSHPEAELPLQRWKSEAIHARWHNPADVSKTFRSADLIEDDTWVFNIAGNNFRLVAIVLFVRDRLYIKQVMIHTEYDQWNKKRR